MGYERLHTPFSSAVLGTGKKKERQWLWPASVAIKARFFKREKIFEMFGSKTSAASNSKEALGWLQPAKLNFPFRFFRIEPRQGKVSKRAQAPSSTTVIPQYKPKTYSLKPIALGS